MKKVNIKQIILISIVAGVLLLNLLAPLFNLMTAKVFSFASASDNGYSVLGSYTSAIEDIVDWLSIWTIVMLVFTITLTVIFVVKMVKGQSIEKISSVITISSVVLNCVYMINGFLTKSTADEVLDGYGEIHTYAYIPFILAVVLVVAYFLLKAFLPEEMGAKAKAQQSAKSENQALQTLLQYKALLDSGVITQEEFEAKKAELLPSHGLPTTPAEEMTTQETISVESLPEKVSCVCPLCRARFKIKYEHIGKRVRCLACQEVVTATPATEQH